MKNKNDLEHIKTLVGLRVLKMEEDGNRTQWQGVITGHINRLVFILLFDALSGTPTCTICVVEEELARDRKYKFFNDLECLDGYYQAYQKYHDINYNEEKKSKRGTKRPFQIDANKYTLEKIYDFQSIEEKTDAAHD